MEDIQPKSIRAKAARVNAGLSQPDAAKKLHLSVNQLKYIENKTGKLTLEMAWEMSELYNIPVWALSP